MSDWKRLLAPCGLGFLAAAANFVAMSQRLEPDSFVGLRSAVDRGEELKESNLVEIKTNLNAASLDNMLVRWSDRNLVTGRTAVKQVHAGAISGYEFEYGSAQIPEQHLQFGFRISADKVNKEVVPGDNATVILSRPIRDKGASGDLRVGPFRVASLKFIPPLQAVSQRDRQERKPPDKFVSVFIESGHSALALLAEAVEGKTVQISSVEHDGGK